MPKLLAIYGTEFDELDEDEAGVSKKPAQIHEQVATDERGRRRFHGAFTGGFSAGYFNTVGTKEGWKPQEFRSSVEQRALQNQQRIEDIMDEEDLGEFGISARRIRKVDTFSDSSLPTGKRRLAWEHDEATTSAISSQIEQIIKPCKSSIGVRMLRAMGWREGRGVGLATSKEIKTRGGESEEARFDREQAAKVAPGHELSLEDELVAHLKAVDGVHGLGYQGLRQTNVLDEGYVFLNNKIGRIEAALKAANKKRSRGIRGQAFGVGVFEDEDESIYSQFDLSKYDFALDVPGGSGPADVHTKVDSTFEEMPKKMNPRPFYPAPRIPPHFQPKHKPIPMNAEKLPEGVQRAMKNLNIVQRAKLLGEDRVSAAELLKSSDRKKLDNVRTRGRTSRWDQKAPDDEFHRRNDAQRIAFPEEPMKQSRFKEFLNHLRRGLPWPKPTDMSTWQWEAEKKDFEERLTTEERAMLPEVRSRTQPLAKSSLAVPIQEMLRSKFVKESGSSGAGTGKGDEDKMLAVKMGMFGERTRTTYEWHPDNLLCRRFNVPNPFSGSFLVGCPDLQKTARREETLINLGLPNTASEIAAAASSSRYEEPSEQQTEIDALMASLNEPEEKLPEERPPDDIFDAIFGGSDDESDDEYEDEPEEVQRKREQSPSSDGSSDGDEKEKEAPKKVLTVIDLVDDDGAYGPAPPPSTSKSGEASFNVLDYLREELQRKKKSSKDKTSHKSKKKKKEKKKKSKKEKKSKKHKKRRSRTQSSSSSSDSDSDIEVIG